MVRKSKYVLYIENISSATRSGLVKKELEYAGPVLDVEKCYKSRSAIAEFKSSSDAAYAWRKMDGISVDGRKWKVDYATKADFKYFGWKVPEEVEDSPSRSPTRSPVRSEYSD